MYAHFQGTYYTHCCQFITEFIAKNCESNKLHNQQNSHKMKFMKNIFQNNYMLIFRFHTFTCLQLQGLYLNQYVIKEIKTCKKNTHQIFY